MDDNKFDNEEYVNGQSFILVNANEEENEHKEEPQMPQAPKRKEKKRKSFRA